MRLCEFIYSQTVDDERWRGTKAIRISLRTGEHLKHLAMKELMN